MLVLLSTVNCSACVELNRFSQNSGAVSSKTDLFVMIAKLEAAEVQTARSLSSEITSTVSEMGGIEVSNGVV